MLVMLSFFIPAINLNIERLFRQSDGEFSVPWAVISVVILRYDVAFIFGPA